MEKILDIFISSLVEADQNSKDFIDSIAENCNYVIYVFQALVNSYKYFQTKFEKQKALEFTARFVSHFSKILVLFIEHSIKNEINPDIMDLFLKESLSKTTEFLTQISQKNAQENSNSTLIFQIVSDISLPISWIIFCSFTDTTILETILQISPQSYGGNPIFYCFRRMVILTFLKILSYPNISNSNKIYQYRQYISSDNKIIEALMFPLINEIDTFPETALPSLGYISKLISCAWFFQDPFILFKHIHPSLVENPSPPPNFLYAITCLNELIITSDINIFKNIYSIIEQDECLNYFQNPSYLSEVSLTYIATFISRLGQMIYSFDETKISTSIVDIAYTLSSYNPSAFSILLPFLEDLIQINKNIGPLLDVIVKQIQFIFNDTIKIDENIYLQAIAICAFTNPDQIISYMESLSLSDPEHQYQMSFLLHGWTIAKMPNHSDCFSSFIFNFINFFKEEEMESLFSFSFNIPIYYHITKACLNAISTYHRKIHFNLYEELIQGFIYVFHHLNSEYASLFINTYYEYSKTENPLISANSKIIIENQNFITELLQIPQNEAISLAGFFSNLKQAACRIKSHQDEFDSRKLFYYISHINGHNMMMNSKESADFIEYMFLNFNPNESDQYTNAAYINLIMGILMEKPKEFNMWYQTYIQKIDFRSEVDIGALIKMTVFYENQIHMSMYSFYLDFRASLLEFVIEKISFLDILLIKPISQFSENEKLFVQLVFNFIRIVQLNPISEIEESLIAIFLKYYKNFIEIPEALDEMMKFAFEIIQHKEFKEILCTLMNFIVDIYFDPYKLLSTNDFLSELFMIHSQLVILKSKDLDVVQNYFIKIGAEKLFTQYLEILQPIIYQNNPEILINAAQSSDRVFAAKIIYSKLKMFATLNIPI